MNSLEPTQIYRVMTRYNRWMNEKLMAECSKVSDEERKKSMDVPFGSLHGLWNHILLADRAWLARFAGETVPFKSLNEEIASDWNEFKQQRTLTDAKIDEFVSKLTTEQLASTLHFVSISSPQPRTIPMIIAVQHLFNHQTHHRGQITVLMELMGLDCGITDLPVLPDANNVLEL